MALSESALSELLDAFTAGDGIDLVRDPRLLAAQAGFRSFVAGGAADL